MNEKPLHPCWNEKVGHLPLQKPLILKDTETIADCIRLMQECNRGCVLIVNDVDALVGLLTERDLMHHFMGTELSSRETVRKVMTEDVFTISPDLDVTQTMDLFGDKPFRHLPVVKDNDILGLLSVRVLVDFIAENVPQELLNLPPEVGDVPKETFGA